MQKRQKSERERETSPVDGAGSVLERRGFRRTKSATRPKRVSLPSPLISDRSLDAGPDRTQMFFIAASREQNQRSTVAINT